MVEYSGPCPAPIQSGAIIDALRGSCEEQLFITSRFM